MDQSSNKAMAKRKRNTTESNTAQPPHKQLRRTLDRGSNSLRGVPIVTLLVGGDRVPYHVHMDVLCQASSFFQKAFVGSGDFKETSERSMTLPEDDPEIFDYLTRWLYIKEIVLNDQAAKDSVEKAEAWYLRIARIYVAADKYDILELKNVAIDQCYNFLLDDDFAGPPTQFIDYVYENTTPQSQVRSLLAEHFVWHVNLGCYFKKSVNKHLRERSIDFVTDVLVCMANKAYRGRDPWTLGSIFFHEGAKDSP